jgi:hypothetical protein
MLPGDFSIFSFNRAMNTSRYIWVVVGLTMILFGGWKGAGLTVKLGCLPPGGIGPADAWLQNCASPGIGVRDDGVIYFGTEPSVESAVRAANVLIFGDSRIEFAISRGNASQWFQTRGIRSYLLAFGGGAESGWAQKLLGKFHPHPDVLIFNVDPYFTGGLGPHGQAIAADPIGELRAIKETQSFVEGYAKYCRLFGWLCGRTSAAYRAILDGHVFSYHPERFWFGKAMAGNLPIHEPPPWDTAYFDSYLQNARSVISSAGVDPTCVVFTTVPNSEQDDSLARFLADRLGGSAISPQFDGLTTSDGSHLSQESSEIWTSAFLERAQPIFQRCVRPSDLNLLHSAESQSPKPLF